MEDTTGGVEAVSLEEETSAATITTINYPELTALTVARIFKSVEKTVKAIDKLTQIVAGLYEERKLSAGTTSEPALDAKKPRYQDMPCTDTKKEVVKLPDEQMDTDQKDPTILDEVTERITVDETSTCSSKSIERSILDNSLETDLLHSFDSLSQEEQARITDRLENLRMRLLRTKTHQQIWDPEAKLFPPVEENSITKNGPAEPTPTLIITEGKNTGPEGKESRNQLEPNFRGFYPEY
ncbi:UNVERIFIED_CONTAM: hypothetical protein K2H54_054798 [Gekko kuhli]